MDYTKADISERTNVNNIVELFKDTATLAKEVYDDQTRFDVGKDFIDGDFPCLIAKQGENLYLSFRGTKNDFSSFTSSIESIRNMIIDASTGDILGENTSLAEFPVFRDCLPEWASVLTGHAGFMRELEQYYNTVKNEINIFVGQVRDLIITGHSAGGGIATLFYYIYMNDFKIKKKIPVKNVITYGSPRVIRDTYQNTELFRTTCKDLIRCFNANDIVTYTPLRKPSSWGGSLISGFVHVGFPFPLDTNIETNSLNGLILQVLRGNKDKFDEIFLNYNLDEIRENNIIGLITSDKYLSVIGESLFQCYTKVATNPEVTDSMLLEYTHRLLQESEKILDYSLKCGLASPLGVTEILKNNNIYNSEIQEDIGLTGISSALLGYSKVSVEAHGMDKYIENIERLERRELETGKTPLEPIENTTTQYPLPTEPVPVTTSNVYNGLVTKILTDIDSGKIVGAIEIDDDDLPSIIIYE